MRPGCRRQRRGAASFTALAVFLVLLFLSGCKRSGLSPGSNAPPFSLKTLSGESLSLADFQGKVVVLNFWATWCPSCVEEMPALERLYSMKKNAGIVVVAIATRDDVDSVREMKERMKLTMPIVMDDDGKISDKYKATGFPETFLIDRQGKIRLFTDPTEGVPVAKAVGPRPWDSAPFLALLSSL